MEPEPVAYKCNVCGWGFTASESREWQKHVGDCARQNMTEIVAKSPKGTVWDDEEWSPEASKHVREVGERMLKEGRLEMKPSERVHNE
jgi:hypothetical protein